MGGEAFDLGLWNYLASHDSQKHAWKGTEFWRIRRALMGEALYVDAMLYYVGFGRFTNSEWELGRQLLSVFLALSHGTFLSVFTFDGYEFAVDSKLKLQKIRRGEKPIEMESCIDAPSTEARPACVLDQAFEGLTPESCVPKDRSLRPRQMRSLVVNLAPLLFAQSTCENILLCVGGLVLSNGGGFADVLAAACAQLPPILSAEAENVCKRPNNYS